MNIYSIKMELNNSQKLVFSAFCLVVSLLLFDIIIKVYVHIITIIIVYLFYRILEKQNVKKIEIQGQGVFITGCDTGFGHEIALRLASLGFTVFAGCLRAEGEGANDLLEKGGEKMYVVPLDVTKDESVDQALEIVRNNMPANGVWAIINNAAIKFAAEIEFARIETMKCVAEVNYYGIVRVTKAFLPLIRESKGRVVNITSVKGRLAVPTDAAYVSAKWAGEAFSDILRREMYRFGVKVVIIEPGNSIGATSILQGDRLKLAESELNESWEQASTEIKAAYGRECIDSLINNLRNISKVGCKSMNPVIDAMLDAVLNVNPKCRYLVHGSNKRLDKYCVLAILNQYLPEPAMDYIYRVLVWSAKQNEVQG